MNSKIAKSILKTTIFISFILLISGIFFFLLQHKYSSKLNNDNIINYTFPKYKFEFHLQEPFKISEYKEVPVNETQISAENQLLQTGTITDYAGFNCLFSVLTKLSKTTEDFIKTNGYSNKTLQNKYLIYTSKPNFNDKVSAYFIDSIINLNGSVLTLTSSIEVPNENAKEKIQELTTKHEIIINSLKILD